MRLSILLELDLSSTDDSGRVIDDCRQWNMDGFILDTEYQPVFMYDNGSQRPPTSVILHGWVASKQVITTLESLQSVKFVWQDTVVEPTTFSV
jgi:hypothetical protein